MRLKSMATKTIYYGAFVHSKSLKALDICEHGAIGVNSAGVIEFVERNFKKLQDVFTKHGGYKDAAVVEAKEGQFFFPGFIDTHIHAPQYPNAGIFGASTLLDWLQTYTFPMESSLSSLSRARTVYSRVVSRTLSHGTTTASYYATLHVPATNLLASICFAAGQRAFVGRVCMDDPNINPEYLRDESPESALADTQSTIAHIKSIDPTYSLVSPIITPRFAPSCTSDLLHKLGHLAKTTNLPCQTHISENTNEINLVKELFPSHSSYAAVYDHHGLLTSKMILGHAIHLTASERELIKSRDSKISHCPVSNSALTSGAAFVRTLLNEGITVGLGTDVSGGYSSSMLEVVRQATLVSRHVAMTDGEDAKLALEEALYLATRGGAKVVGLEDKIGGFDIGKEWDAMLVNLTMVPEGKKDASDEDMSIDEEVFTIDNSDGPVDVFGWETWPERVAKWVYNGDDRNTFDVWVKGRKVFSRKR